MLKQIGVNYYGLRGITNSPLSSNIIGYHYHTLPNNLYVNQTLNTIFLFTFLVIKQSTIKEKWFKDITNINACENLIPNNTFPRRSDKEEENRKRKKKI